MFGNRVGKLYEMNYCYFAAIQKKVNGRAIQEENLKKIDQEENLEKVGEKTGFRTPVGDEESTIHDWKRNDFEWEFQKENSRVVKVCSGLLRASKSIGSLKGL